MRLIVVWMLLVSSVFGAEPVKPLSSQFDPARCEVVGSRDFSPERIQQELWHNPIVNKLCYEPYDAQVIATELRKQLLATYHFRSYWDADVKVTERPGGHFRIEVQEGSKYRTGDVQIVGNRGIDAEKLKRWLQTVIPSQPEPFVLEVDAEGKPIVQRLPSGVLQRNATDPTLDELQAAAAKLTSDASSPKSSILDDWHKGIRLFDGNPASTAPSKTPSKPNEIEQTSATVHPAKPRPQLEKLGSPLWLPDSSVKKLDAAALERFNRWLALACTEQGYSQAQFRCEFIPRKDTQRVELRITFAEEGPPTRIRKIEVFGNERNRTEQIIETLGLKIGETIDDARAMDLDDRLADLGRFVRHRVTIGTADSGGLATVCIDVREAPHVPPIGEPLSEGQRVLLKAARWLKQWSKNPDGDCVIEAHNASLLQRGIQDPSEALLPTARHLNSTYVGNPSGLALEVSLSNGAQQQGLWGYAGEGSDIEIWNVNRQLHGRIQSKTHLYLELGIQGAPKSPKHEFERVTFIPLITSRVDLPSGFHIEVEPAAFLALHSDEFEDLGDGTLRFETTTGKSTTLIERETGRVTRSTKAIPGEDVDISFRPRARTQAIERLRERTKGLREVDLHAQSSESFFLLGLEGYAELGLDHVPLLPEIRGATKTLLPDLDLAGLWQSLHAVSKHRDAGKSFGLMAAREVGESVSYTGPEVASLLAQPDLFTFWLKLSRLVAQFTEQVPFNGESAIGELFRFDAAPIDFDEINKDPAQKAELRAELRRRLRRAKGLGPMTCLAIVYNTKANQQLNLGREFASIGLSSLDRFDEEIDLMLKPGTTARTLAIGLVDQLRRLGPEGRVALSSFLNLKPNIDWERDVWVLLDQNREASSEVILRKFLRDYWQQSLRQAFSTAFEEATGRGFVGHDRATVYLIQAYVAFSRRDTNLGLLMLDAAERQLDRAVQEQGSRNRGGEVKLAILNSRSQLEYLRVLIHMGDGRNEAAEAALRKALEWNQKQLEEFSEGPVADPFVEGLTPRGRHLKSRISYYETLSEITFLRSGHKAAVQVLAEAEELVAPFREFKEFDEVRALLVEHTSVRAIVLSYRDKSGQCDPVRALQVADEALHLSNKSPLAWVSRACALTAAHRHAEALQSLAEAEKLPSELDNIGIEVRRRMFVEQKISAPLLVPLATAIRAHDEADLRR